MFPERFMVAEIKPENNVLRMMLTSEILIVFLDFILQPLRHTNYFSQVQQKIKILSS